MGQIVSSAAKPKRCNLNKLSQIGTPAAGEYILVSSDNSMNAAGQGHFDCYIIGNNSTAATALEKHYLNESELIIIQTLINSLQGDVVTSDDFTYDGFIYKTTGNLTSHSTYKATDFISVIPGATYIAKFNATANACCGFYGKNKVFTGEFIQNTGTSEIEITIPKGAYYIRMSSNLEAARMLKLKGYNFADVISLIPTKTSDLTNDSGFVGDDTAATKTKHDYNILAGLTPTQNVVLNTDGTTTANATCFTYEKIDISEYVGVRLYPYTKTAGTHCFRNAATFDASGNFVRHFGGGTSLVENGFILNENEVKVSFCFVKTSEIPEHYIATVKGNPPYYKLDDVEIPYPYLTDTPNMSRPKIYPLTKLPCLSIHFDDMNYDGDTQVVELFKKYNAVCGFACLGSSAKMAADYAEDYLLWNKDGFDIINHSINGNAFNTTNYTYATALAAIMEAKNNLEKRGYVVNGFVAPSSAMEESFKPILRLSQGFAFTTSTSSPTANGRSADRCDLHRYGMQGRTLEQIKSFIDDCITNDQIITLYGHTADFGGTADETWNLEKVEAILQYVIEKRDAGLLYFGSTTDCVKYYFDV